VTRGEIYRTRERVPERGSKPGFYVVVSRAFVAENDDVSTVICAPIYSQVLGLTTEVVVGADDGLPRTSAVRCDFLTLMFKRKLTQFVATLSAEKISQLNGALAAALGLDVEWSRQRA
jgi:mRNA-degrading endonuclease toxin of MazEF toxin-antitoxin module